MLHSTYLKLSSNSSRKNRGISNVNSNDKGSCFFLRTDIHYHIKLALYKFYNMIYMKKIIKTLRLKSFDIFKTHFLFLLNKLSPDLIQTI